MADQAINALSTKTAPETSDQLLLVGAGEPQLIDYDKLADAILNKITSKKYALDAGTMTLPAALNALNGKKESNSENIDSASDLAEDVLEKCHNGEIRLFTIQSTVSIEKGSPDGKGGFLLAYQSKTGSTYGIVVIFSYDEKIWMKVKNITWNNWKKIQLS